MNELDNNDNNDNNGNSVLNRLETLNNEADQSYLWKGTFREFLKKYENDKQTNPNIGVLAHQRLYNMIITAGTKKIDHFGKERTQYNFFEDTLFGIEDSIDGLMSYFHSASQKTETSRRMLLMYGPPSSGKSYCVQLLKRGLEAYTRTEEGFIYALVGSKMHENPFLLIPEKLRPDFERQYGLQIEGQLSPFAVWKLREEHNGKFMEYPVEQIYLDEASRKGIGTWLPQDPKTVSTETTKIFTDGGVFRLSTLFSSLHANLDQEGFAALDGSVSSLDTDEKLRGIYDHGFLPMFRVNAGGIWIDCTTKHRFMTLNDKGDLEWKALQEIDDKTPVLIKTNMQKFGGEQILSDFDGDKLSLSPAISEIVGGLVAEGACTGGNFFYCNTDEYLISQFIALVDDSFLVSPTISRKIIEGKDVGLRGASLPARLTQWLEYNFNLSKGDCEKSVPDVILQASKNNHIAFLEGLFLGDGSIRFKKNRVARFSYATCSEVLAMDVQAMLLNLGIFTRISRYTDKNYSLNTQYQVVSEGQEVYQLSKMFPKFAKHRKFDEAVIRSEVVENRPRYEFFGSLSGLIENIQGKTKGTRGLIDRCYTIKTANRRSPTRLTLQKWHKELNANIEWTCSDLDKRKILDKLDIILNYRCVKIVSTEYLGMRHGVDLSCGDSGTFSYVTNGLISHNSSDQSELIGSIDFAKIQEFGDEADPRVYNFNGELNVANRGVMEFIEGLRADERFLRVLLTATQEKSIKAPRFGLIYCDIAILLHTNEEEFKIFMAEKKYEAYHDRMIIVRVPYNLSVKNEVKIYDKLLSTSDAIKNMHIAPKTLQSAAMFAVLSRLTPPVEGGDLTLLKKMKLYDKQQVRGYKIEQVPSMKKKDQHEGMTGVSPRFVIDQISAAISAARDADLDYITPLDVLRQLNKGVLGRDSYKQEVKNRYEALIEEARSEWDDMLRNDIQKAFFVSYEAEARNLCENYFDEIEAACSGTKRRDPITNKEIDPDDKLMDSIEEQIDVTSSGKEDFRNEILRAVGTAARKQKQFDYTEHAQLREAIQKKLFEERKNVIRMTVSTRNPDPEELKKINEVVDRMVEQQGYSALAANALLKYATAHLFDK